MTMTHLTLPSSSSNFWQQNKMAVFPHPPYSPDLAPCDFFLFPKIKLRLKGRHFDTIKEIQAIFQKVLNPLTGKDFQEAFQKWRRLVSTCGRELLVG
jgi:transposase